MRISNRYLQTFRDFYEQQNPLHLYISTLLSIGTNKSELAHLVGVSEGELAEEIEEVSKQFYEYKYSLTKESNIEER